MAFVNIENIDRLGIIKDQPDHTLPPEAWSNGSNVRFVDGKVQKFSGEQDVFNTPEVNPHFILPWNTASGQRWLYADAEKIYHIAAGVSTNVTRYTTTQGDDDYSGASRPIWTGNILHGVPIVNHNNVTDYPQQWDFSTSRFKDLSNWPANTYCQAIRSFKNYLIALDITKSGNRYPYLVKWSHPADAGLVPTSWDETDATKLAGEFPLSQTGGFVLDCLPLSGSNIVYKSDAIWSMTPTGGLDVFRFSPIIQTLGMLATRCGTEIFGQHFIVGGDDIYLFNGNSPQTIVNERLRKWFYNNLHSTHYDKTVVIPNYPKQEVWVCFVESGSVSEYLTKALVWNWTTNTWTIKDLPATSFLAYGLIDTNADIFNTASGSFDTDFGPFNIANVAPGEKQLLHAKVYGTATFLQGDLDYTSQNNSYSSYVERTGLGIVGTDRTGQPKVDQTKRKFLRAIYPKIESTVGVTLNVYAGTQDFPGGPVTWSAPQEFNSNTDVKVNFAVNGKYLAVKFESSDSVFWSMSGYSLDVDVIGNL